MLRFTLVLKQKLWMEYFDRVLQVHVVKVDADRNRTTATTIIDVLENNFSSFI